jgi:rhodanese-related sulfurtransferase
MGRLIKPTTRRIGILLLAGGVLAVVANGIRPQGIPWVQDWSRYVEAKAAKQGIRVIPLSVALEKFQSLEATFVDARSADEFADGHVSGAVSIPFQSLEEHFPALGSLVDSGRELVVYCSNRECDDALLLAIELQAMGAKRLVLYVDGFDLWQEYGGAVEGGE